MDWKPPNNLRTLKGPTRADAFCITAGKTPCMGDFFWRTFSHCRGRFLSRGSVLKPVSQRSGSRLTESAGASARTSSKAQHVPWCPAGAQRDQAEAIQRPPISHPSMQRDCLPPWASSGWMARLRRCATCSTAPSRAGPQHVKDHLGEAATPVWHRNR